MKEKNKKAKRKPFVISIMDVFSRALVTDLMINGKKYGIKNTSDLDIINDSVLINLFLILKKLEEELKLEKTEAGIPLEIINAITEFERLVYPQLKPKDKRNLSKMIEKYKKENLK